MNSTPQHQKTLFLAKKKEFKKQDILIASSLSVLLLMPVLPHFTLAAEINTAQQPLQSFNIPAGDLASALNAIAVQTGFTLSIATDMLKGKITQGVSGSMSTKQAIKKVLAETGLTYRIIDGNIITLVKQKPGQASRSSIQNRVFDLPGLVIEATRVNSTQENSPQTITMISQEQIEQQLALSQDSSQVLSNLLPAYSPNTQKLNNSSQTFRGRSVLYMIDGVPQSNPLREGSRSAHTIDLAMVERIEVVHGASAVQGLGATGAIINFITKSAATEQIEQQMSVQATSPTQSSDGDTLSYKVNYQIQGAQNNFDYLLGLTGQREGVYLNADGDYVGAASVRGDIMDAKSYDGFLKLGYNMDDNQRLQLSYNRYQVKGMMNFAGVEGDRDLGIATSSIKSRPVGEAPFNKVQTINLDYSNDDLAGMIFKAQVFDQNFKARYGATTSSSFQDASITDGIFNAENGRLYDQSQNESHKMGAKFNFTRDDLLEDTLTMTAGLDILKDTTRQKLTLTNRTYVPKTVYQNYAPFVQAEYQPIEKWIIQAGVRHESAELDIDTYQTVAARNGVTVQGGSPDFNKTIYNIGSVYKLTPSMSLFANFSQGFGMPDVGRVLRGVSKENQTVDQLIDLQPIITDNYEAGIRFNNHSISMEASYYQSYSDLGSRLVLNNGLYTVSRQKQEIKGAEISLGLALNQQHHVKAGYSYIQGRYDSNDDGKVDTKLSGASIPPNRLVTSWSADWNHQLSTLVQLNYAFDRSFDSETLDFDGFALVDLSANYQLPKGRLNLSIANAFNQDYFTYYSQAAYANDDFYFKGRGRTVSLQYSLDF